MANLSRRAKFLSIVAALGSMGGVTNAGKGVNNARKKVEIRSSINGKKVALGVGGSLILVAAILGGRKIYQRYQNKNDINDLLKSSLNDDLPNDYLLDINGDINNFSFDKSKDTSPDTNKNKSKDDTSPDTNKNKSKDDTSPDTKKKIVRCLDRDDFNFANCDHAFKVIQEINGAICESFKSKKALITFNLKDIKNVYDYFQKDFGTKKAEQYELLLNAYIDTWSNKYDPNFFEHQQIDFSDVKKHLREFFYDWTRCVVERIESKKIDIPFDNEKVVGYMNRFDFNFANSNHAFEVFCEIYDAMSKFADKDRMFDLKKVGNVKSFFKEKFPNKFKEYQLCFDAYISMCEKQDKDKDKDKDKNIKYNKIDLKELQQWMVFKVVPWRDMVIKGIEQKTINLPYFTDIFILDRKDFDFMSFNGDLFEELSCAKETYMKEKKKNSIDKQDVKNLVDKYFVRSRFKAQYQQLLELFIESNFKIESWKSLVSEAIQNGKIKIKYVPDL